MRIGPLDKIVTIKYPVSTPDPVYGTPLITWTTLATVYANVEDVMPSRAESVKLGLSVALNQVRVRFNWRDDVTSAMTITLAAPDSRVLQIIAGPASIGDPKSYSEVMAEKIL